MRVGLSKEPARQHDGLEETLGQIVRIAVISSDGGDEGADGRVIPLGKFVQRRGRLAAVAGSFRKEIPGCRGELLAYRRTLLLPYFWVNGRSGEWRRTNELRELRRNHVGRLVDDTTGTDMDSHEPIVVR